MIFSARVGSHRVQRSLFGEIIYWLLIPLLICWPASIIITCLMAHSMAETASNKSLTEHALLLASHSQGNIVGEGRITDPAHSDQTLAYVAVRDTTGGWLAGEPELRLPTGPRTPGEIFSTVVQDQPVRATWLELPRTAQSNARILLVAQPNERNSELSNAIILKVIFPQSLFLPLTLAIIWMALHVGLKPLSALQNTIRTRRSDDLSPIDASQVPDDVVPLVNAFNDLLERLSDSLATQKRFIADAAHQLKTPLAGMRTQAELGLRLTDMHGIQRSLQQLYDSSRSATRLVNQLLSLARAETRFEQGPSRDVDLRNIARETVLEWLSQAQHHHIDLGFEDLCPASTTPTVEGDAVLLHELLANLIDNAVRYTQELGQVTVRVLMRDGLPLWLVEDNGPGIPAAERERVFERFYRIIGNKRRGSGLGLAIVREIAQRQNAEVTISDANPDNESCPGCLITVTFRSLPSVR
jgi:two-component system sensor histidine kinase TctE